MQNANLCYAALQEPLQSVHRRRRMPKEDSRQAEYSRHRSRRETPKEQ